MQFISVLIIAFLIKRYVCIDIEELFGIGEPLFNNVNVENNFWKDPSYSTEDLLLLWQFEKKILKNEFLQQSSRNETKLNKIIKGYMKYLDYDLSNENLLDYVYHPMNALKLLKRVPKFLNIIGQIMPNIKTDFHRTANDYNRAYHGIADIHEFYGLKLNELIKGKIKSYETGKIYQAKSPLTSHDLLEIAKEARKVKYLDGYVDWLNVALKQAKKEKRNRNYINAVKVALKNGKLQHDAALLESNLDHKVHLGFTRDVPFSPLHNKTSKFFERRVSLSKSFNSNYKNLVPKGHNWDQVVDLKMDVLYRKRTQDLCKGTFRRNSYEKSGLICILLHHNDPYLRLGPFKLEALHLNPEIAIIHEFASSEEIKEIKDLARGRMKCTPYFIKGTENESSKERTSKIMYMNEYVVPEAMTLSRKIEKATKFNLYNEKFASENYQIMNYGIGGTISPHVDSESVFKEELPDGALTTENLLFGGPRFVTFMIFLSSVEAGGHTVFPQAEISVKPVEGSALYWFNMDAQNNLDSRIRHLGCPVLFGNKWIANKWVKWLPNFKQYPCLIDRENYSIFPQQLTNK